MEHTKHSLGWSLLFLNTALLIGYGCNYDGDISSYGPGDIGATPGGAQDIAYARKLITSGTVPESSTVTVEGLLSEHDIPSTGAPCDSMLCVRPALGIAPSLETGEEAWWVQLGVRSALATSTDAYERPPADVVILIDRSSPMSIDMEETNEAVTSIIDQLQDSDRIGILAFNRSVTEIQPFGPLGDRETLKSNVRKIQARGSSNLAAGLKRAYAEVRGGGNDPARLRRVIVLSCGYPQVNAEGTDAFSKTVQEGATERIGLTFLGVLLPFDHNLADRLSQERGGAYYYASNLREIETFFDHELDFMLSPIAYDLQLGLTVSDGFEVDRVFGIPGDQHGEPRTHLETATAFPSRRGGAIVVRLRRNAGTGTSTSLGNVSLNYQPETAHGVSGDLEVPQEIRYTRESLPENHTYFEGTGIRKAVTLVNQAERMITAIDTYHDGDTSTATAILDTLLTYLRIEAKALTDNALTAEITLIEKLRENMK